ncbi:hypothetical protein EVAR_17114_1 [Eumeta japonica]|uniref:Uncharacterized protein n=1 Tax=Eumeta variegata TaxID=151549 RepID=A0A4C1UNJ2_EUMVA|nr:hypothetical protein EVAR_17114_1 [Eumeta japonica]
MRRVGSENATGFGFVSSGGSNGRAGNMRHGQEGHHGPVRSCRIEIRHERTVATDASEIGGTTGSGTMGLRVVGSGVSSGHARNQLWQRACWTQMARPGETTRVSGLTAAGGGNGRAGDMWRGQRRHHESRVRWQWVAATGASIMVDAVRGCATGFGLGGEGRVAMKM